MLGALVYLQIREWRRFDWATFRENTEDIQWVQILLGVALIHLADFLRAIASEIESLGEELIDRASAETALDADRLRGERGGKHLCQQ